jgi:predicted nuclease of predicted toxin-antitoxin system
VRFLADESCDAAVVAALRAAGHDVSAVAESDPGIDDEQVLMRAHSERRILIAEDKDFGVLAYADGRETAGVILIRFPGDVRSELGQTMVDAVAKLGDRLGGAFVVVEPGRVRLSRRILDSGRE